MERGVVTSDLNVSIYDDDGGPNTDIPLASVVVPSENISSSFEWIECDFTNILLTGGDTYYIGANTSGGSFGNGSYNYYKWYIDENSPYNSSSYGANVTDDDGGNWTSISGYDFEYRLKFTDNSPPDTPTFSIPQALYSGVNKKVVVDATDPEGNQVRYRISWGDGNISSWTDLLTSGAPHNFWHIYAKPGMYTLTIQAKDNYSDIYEPDNVTEIYVQTGDYLPEDSYKSCDGLDPDGNGVVTAPWDLNGTLRIDLFSSGYGHPYGGLWGDIPFGRIRVFDLGSITYESPHDIGTQRTIFENGGILTFGPIGNNIKSKPSFFEEDDAIGFRIIQIGKSYTTSAGGSGTYEIGLNMKNSYSREPRITEPGFSTVYNFKMQIHDSFEKVEDLWINYFTTSYDFDKISDRPNTIYYQGNKKLVLDSSFIEVNIEGIR